MEKYIKPAVEVLTFLTREPFASHNNNDLTLANDEVSIGGTIPTIGDEGVEDW